MKFNRIDQLIKINKLKKFSEIIFMFTKLFEIVILVSKLLKKGLTISEN